MRFEFERTEIPDVILIKTKCFEDERGFFKQHFDKTVFSENGIKYDFVQDYHSFSKRNVLRGLHYQKSPYAQGKLVSVIKGAVLDVAVDIRKDSNTYLKWVSFELNDENNYQLWVPPGLAHGFLSLKDGTHFFYKVTEYYHPESELGIIWNDPTLGIKWGIKNPILSEKDTKHPNIEK